MGKNKHQHFVPKLYQKGFSENNFIYSLDKTNKPYKPNQISIRDSLVKKNMYSLEKVGLSVELIIEETLSKIEGNMSFIIKKISNCEELTHEDLLKFIHFIAIQRLRSPTCLENLKEQCLKVNEVVLKVGIDKLETTKNDILELAFQNINELGKVLWQKKWTFSINTNQNKLFITSDFPVYCVPPQNQNINAGWGIGSPDVKIFFPITQNIIAFGQELKGNIKDSVPHYSYIEEEIDERFVDGCNRWTAIASDKYIISSKSEILIESLNFSDLDLLYSNLSKRDTMNINDEIIKFTSRF